MSQIATTIEQSKRLLAAGLDPGSADMYWLGSGATISSTEDKYKLYTEPYFHLYEHITEAIKNEKADRKNYGFDTSNEIRAKEDFLSRLFPAWSLSRLWDLLSGTVLGGWFSLGSDTSEDVIEKLVVMIEERHANH